MTTKKVKFAILGCGIISEYHVKAIIANEESELVAVCDRIEENMSSYVEQTGCHAYTNYAEMLEQKDIEVVCICTPSGMHPKQTRMAAEAGKHVVCEKPMGINLQDVKSMIDVCKQRGVLLTTIFPWRMSPVLQYVKQFISDGGLGKLSLCSAQIKPFRPQSYYDSAGWRGTWNMDGGGVLMNQGIHTVDYLQWLVGPVQSLYGKIDHVLRDIEVEDTAVAVLTFEHGGLGMINASTTAYESPDYIEIHGEKGTIKLEEGKITTFAIVDGEPPEYPAFEDFKVLPDGHRLQLKDFAQAIREGRAPYISGEDGIHSLEIILGIYQSSQSNQELVFSKTV